MVSEMREPYSRRLKMSLPRLSVPKRNTGSASAPGVGVAVGAEEVMAEGDEPPEPRLGADGKKVHRRVMALEAGVLPREVVDQHQGLHLRPKAEGGGIQQERRGLVGMVGELVVGPVGRQELAEDHPEVEDDEHDEGDEGDGPAAERAPEAFHAREYLMRGSTSASATSEISIPTRMRKLMNMMLVITRLMSFWMTASYISRPMPG